MKKLKFTYFCLIGLFVFIMISCASDNATDIEPTPPPAANCDTDNVNYAQEVLTIINSSCAISGCHVSGGSGNGNFETYAGVKAKVDNGSFKDRVIDKRTMPRNNPLSDCQINQLSVWLSDGAPNN